VLARLLHHHERPHGIHGEHVQHELLVHNVEPLATWPVDACVINHDIQLGALGGWGRGQGKGLRVIECVPRPAPRRRWQVWRGSLRASSTGSNSGRTKLP
jgi:hypothetical protein